MRALFKREAIFPTAFLVIILGVASGESLLASNVLLEGNCSDATGGATSFDDCSLCSCTRKLRVSTFMNSDCPITEDMLLRIMSLLQYAWRLITGTFSSGSRTLIYDNVALPPEDNCVQLNAISTGTLWKLSSDHPFQSEPCEGVISDIETLILDITEQIRRLIAWLDDPENFNPRIVQLEECLRCVNKKLDDTIAEYDDQLGNFTQRFGDMQHCFIDAINERKNEIKKLQLHLEEKSYKLIGSSVNASSYTTALSEFINLNNNTILGRLTDDLYGAEKLENLLRFAYILPTAEQRVIVYNKINYLLQQHGHHQTMRALSFNKVVYDDVRRICGSTEIIYCTALPDEYRSVLILVDVYTKNVKKALEEDICQGKHRTILQTGSSEISVNLAGNAFLLVLPDIVKGAYGRCPNNLHIILDFLTNLRWNMQKPVGFEALLSVVTDQSKMMHVAMKMKEAGDNLNGPDGKAEEAKDEIFELRDKLPPIVKSIVWHSTCTIRRNNDLQYLYISGRHIADNSRTMVTATNQTTAQWIFIPIVRDNGDLQYQIINSRTEEFLGTHIPWRNNGEYFGHAAASRQDDGEYPPRHFNWEIHTSGNSPTISLWHIGRQAYFRTSGSEGYLQLSSRKNTGGTDWRLDCNDEY